MLSVHFQLISGSGFEFNVTDGSTSNKTLLSRITSDYNGMTIKTSSSSVLELAFYSARNAKTPAILKMIIMKDRGKHLPQKTKVMFSIWCDEGKSQLLKLVMPSTSFMGALYFYYHSLHPKSKGKKGREFVNFNLSIFRLLYFCLLARNVALLRNDNKKTTSTLKALLDARQDRKSVV